MSVKHLTRVIFNSTWIKEPLTLPNAGLYGCYKGFVFLKKLLKEVKKHEVQNAEVPIWRSELMLGDCHDNSKQIVLLDADILNKD